TYRYNSNGELYESVHEYGDGEKHTYSHDPDVQHTVSDKIKYVKVGVSSKFVEQIKNDYGINLAA
ncbi:MAG: hypothetical protein ACI4I1_11120, partial [Oscillospiraceae bacterium]